MPLRVGPTYTQMKLGWAYKRLDDLKGEVAKFRNDAYVIRREDDVQNARHRIYIEQKITPDPIGMLIGEFAYCIRSGLDQLTWQLALITTDKPGRLTAFPIESQCPLPSNKGFNEKVASIPPQALKVIDDLQPYHSQAALKNHPLWQVNKLCNLDKHQVVAVGCIEFQIGVSGVSAIWRRNFHNATEVSVPLAEKDKVKLDVKVPAIVFGEPIEKTDAVSDFEIGLEGLSKIYEFVRNDVVPRFEVFFPK